MNDNHEENVSSSLLLPAYVMPFVHLSGLLLTSYHNTDSEFAINSSKSFSYTRKDKQGMTLYMTRPTMPQQNIHKAWLVWPLVAS